MSMTVGASSSSQVESVLRQMIEQYILGMVISSAGGNSPETNNVISLPEVSGFGDVIDSAIRDAIIGHLEDQNKGDVLPKDQSITEGQAVGLGRGALSKLQNPAQIVSEGLAFLPHAVVVSFAISLLPTIINELTKPGGDFDLRFKRKVEEEYNSIEERKYLYDINVGKKGLIFQTRAGFLSHNQTGAMSANTLRLIRDGGIDKSFQTQIDYVDHAQGLF